MKTPWNEQRSAGSRVSASTLREALTFRAVRNARASIKAALKSDQRKGAESQGRKESVFPSSRRCVFASNSFYR